MRKTIKCIIKKIKQNYYNITCAKRISGYGKDIYIFKAYVVGYFKSTQQYLLARNNYRQFSDLFVYPVINNLVFNDRWETVRMERVIGKQFEDRMHDDIVINKLFEYALDSPYRVEKNGETTYLQHGDAKRGNIIWKDSQEFVFIDLDGISYLPVLFDILHYCAMAKMTYNDILNILESNITLIKELFEKCKLEYNNNYLDYIFYHYSLYFFRLGNCYDDIAFLNIENTKSLPKTNALMGILNV